LNFGHGQVQRGGGGRWALQLVNATNASNENLSTLQPSRFDLNPTHSEFGEFCVDLHSTHSPQVQLCSSLGSKCKCKYNYIRNPFSGISVCFSYIFQFVSRNCANLWFAVRRRIFEIWVDVTYSKPYYANTIIVIRYI